MTQLRPLVHLVGVDAVTLETTPDSKYGSRAVDSISGRSKSVTPTAGSNSGAPIGGSGSEGSILRAARGMTIDDFVSHPNARRCHLSKAHVVALRLYSTAVIFYIYIYLYIYIYIYVCMHI